MIDKYVYARLALQVYPEPSPDKVKKETPKRGDVKVGDKKYKWKGDSGPESIGKDKELPQNELTFTAKDPGFFGAYYKDTDDHIIITYRGSNSPSELVSNLAWSPLLPPHLQILDAYNFYKAVLEKEGEDANISFTGHSLGGGLAGVMAAFLNKKAVLFAPAPFEKTAQQIKENKGHTFTKKKLFGLETVGIFPGPQDGELHKDKITSYRIDDEIVGKTFNKPGIGSVLGPLEEWTAHDKQDSIHARTDYPIDKGKYPGALHSMGLHAFAAYVDKVGQSEKQVRAFDEMTEKIPRLIPQLVNEAIPKWIRDTTPDADNKKLALEEVSHFFQRLLAEENNDYKEVLGNFMADLTTLKKLNPQSLAMADPEVNTALLQCIIEYAQRCLVQGAEPGSPLLSGQGNLLRFHLDLKNKDEGSPFHNFEKVTFSETFLGHDLLKKHVTHELYESAWKKDFPLIISAEVLIFLEKFTENIQKVTISKDGGVSAFFSDESSEGFHDLVFGGKADDVFYGGQGNDILLGRSGDDRFKPGSGHNFILGGGGIDSVSYADETQAIKIEMFRKLLGTHNTFIAFKQNKEEDILTDIEKLTATDFDDHIDLINPKEPHDGQTHGEEAQELIIDAGAGDDVVKVKGSAIIYLGAGHDTLIHSDGPGSEIHLGPGGRDDRDVVTFSSGTRVFGVDGYDKISVLGGLSLSGTALKSANSESKWTYALGGLVKVGFNSEGDMVLAPNFIRDTNNPNNWMFLANGNRNPLADAADLTAGIRVGVIGIKVWELMSLPSGMKGSNIWEFTRKVLKDFFAGNHVAGADPLVLDLDGDGLELTTVSTSAPQFDMDGDGFAEYTGWVGADDGLLVLDKNKDGVINNIHELFGGNGQSGFQALSQWDKNKDGVLDISDTVFTQLRVWQDLNQDGLTDEGELRSLRDVGIRSISLAAQEDGTINALNRVARKGTFLRDDSTSGTIGDVDFRINNFNTKYTGDTRVDDLLTANMPNLKGYGTLTDLHVALTLEGKRGGLAQTITKTLPGLNIPDLSELRQRAFPVLKAWAEASPGSGSPSSSNPDIFILVSRGENGLQILDFAVMGTEDVPLEDGSTVSRSFYKLASGKSVSNQKGELIPYPDYQDVLTQASTTTGTKWEVLKGEELDYLERFYGEKIPVEDPRSLNAGAIDAFSQLLTKSFHIMELQAVRLAMQGPLSSYFDGVKYDVGTDQFVPTTDRQLTPMFEAIFKAAPKSTDGAARWLGKWKPLVDTVLTDYDRGGSLDVNYPFLFTTIVAAAENVNFILTPKTTALVFGIPQDLIVTGSGTITGSNEKEIFYLSTGNDRVIGKGGADVYVVGKNFGHDVIDDHENLLQHSFDVLRFAHHNPEDFTFYRDGLNVRIVDKKTGDTLTILGEFYELKLSLFGGHVGPERGVDEIIFADGTVWNRSDLAKAVSHPLDSDQKIIGTDHADYLDGGGGQDYLSGGSGSDIYVFGRGYGHDTIEEKLDNILLPKRDFLFFGPGITKKDIIFSLDGDSENLIISIKGTKDKLVIKDQFEAVYTGPFGKQWFNTVETFIFEDGTSLNWLEVAKIAFDHTSTDGDDIIYGFSFEDTLDGGAGNDYLSGGNENDIYKFDLGYGHDIIEENYDNILSGRHDKVQFGAGILPENVRLARSGDHLVITFAGSSDQLTVRSQFNYLLNASFDLIEEYVFSDGTVWTANDVRVSLLAGTDGDDVLVGYFTEDILDGGKGNDRLEGADSKDTYRFDIGYGQDVIYEWASIVMYEYDQDVVEFGAGISPSDLILSRSGYYDLIFNVKDTSDQLTVKNQLDCTIYDGIEFFKFSDGTIWTPGDIRKKLLQSTSGEDRLIGFDTDDVLDGGQGNDHLEGKNGNDVYKFNRGYGQDTVYDNASSSGDVIEFGSGISPSDLTLSRSGYNLIFNVKGTSDQLTVKNQFYSSYGIESFKFSDGTIWTPEDIQSKLLQGTSGEDRLIGFNTDDVLDGGQGNDHLEGKNGNDIYKFNRGYGQDTVYDNASSSGDVIEFGSGISPSDLTLSRSGYNLIFNVKGTSDQLTVKNQFYYSSYGIESFKFSDGTIWTPEDIQSKLLQGTSGEDRLIGFNTDDVLDGGQGNDHLEGKNGNDVYKFNRGYGQDTVYDNASSSGDVIEFGSGISPSDLTLSRSGYNLIFNIKGTSDQLTVKNQFYYSSYGIESFKFSDGTIWTTEDIQSKLLQGTSGEDRLIGFDTDDVLDGGQGNDHLEGKSGNDVYKFNRGYGQDIVYDNASSSGDVIEFGSGISPSDLTLSRSGYNLIFNIKGTSDQLTVKDQFLYSYGIESFKFSDGTIWTTKDIQSKLLQGTSGEDRLIGFNTDDVLDGGQGNDHLEGKNGNDVYKFNRGYGQDIVYDNASSSGDVIEFGAGISLSDLTLSRSGYNLIFNVKGTSDQLTVKDQFLYSYGIEGFKFSDGTIWTTKDIQSKLLQGTSGEDRLIGFDTDDVLDGGQGNDHLEGRNGNDVYKFNRGYGQDTVYDNASSSGDVIEFGSGISPSDLTLSRSGYNLIFNVKGTSDQLTVKNQFYSSYGIESFKFSDGTIWTPEDIQTKLLQGTSGEDRLIGFDTDDVLDGGQGNDHLEGKNGNDVYKFNRGYGQDTVYDNASSSGDVIEFGSGISPSDLTLSRSGYNLIFNVKGTSDQLTVKNQFYSSYGIESFKFSDGTIWTPEDIQTKLLQGTSGEDRLIGFDTDDVLDGGQGNDHLEGKNGNDVYKFNRGYGQDTVYDNASSSGDVIEFGSGISPSDLTLSRSGYNLIFNVKGTSDQLTVKNQFYSSYGIESFKFSDGTIWTTEDIQSKLQPQPSPSRLRRSLPESDSFLFKEDQNLGKVQDFDPVSHNMPSSHASFDGNFQEAMDHIGHTGYQPEHDTTPLTPYPHSDSFDWG